MKKIQYLLGMIASIAAVMAMLISSFQIAIYADFDFYQTEYEKYEVLSDLNMEMEDVMYVTEEMMAYLLGDRESLSVITIVDGQEQDFFNEQDRFHMWEVQKLFMGGLELRRLAISLMINCILLLMFFVEKEKRKNPIPSEEWSAIKILCRSYRWVLAGLAVLIAFVGTAVAVNFSKAFTIFHEIFFDNDLWIFNPAEDYMIRMLPEGLFMDFVVRIGVIFIIMLILTLTMDCLILKHKK